MRNKRVCYYSISGKLTCEKVESFTLLKFLYQNFLGRFLRYLFNNKYIAIVYSYYQKSSLSKRKIKSFIKKHEIDSNEFLKDVSEFSSFNDFFIRKLKPNTREIAAGENIFISPTDSKLLILQELKMNSQFFIKNQNFNLKYFLQNDNLAEEYQNCLMMIFRLAPYDYHRFHFPIDCLPKKPKNINGILESVNPIVYRAGIQPLIENKRDLIVLEKTHLGKILFVVVGAMFVGKIVYTSFFNQENQKGDEIGYFEFGGSSIVVLIKKGLLKPKEVFVNNSMQGLETEVKMGQQINY
ncbi:phosphatidylserine decarboxylase [Candidatus Dependentiae bacterium]|nr:phosphatidylserine decarboxylase [Candidatus Dependentiae bacterium]